MSRTSVTLWVADQYAPGCPGNSSARMAGVGLTRKTAIANARPWANQSAWFRQAARRRLVVDGDAWGAGGADNAAFAWSELGHYADAPQIGVAAAVTRHLNADRWASAFLAALRNEAL